MTLSTVSRVQQIEEQWRAEQLAVFRERQKQKETSKANESNVESRLAALEAEVQKLKEKIESAAQ
jgi:uncharacterized protein YceH (UPF0502 family)